VGSETRSGSGSETWKVGVSGRGFGELDRETVDFLLENPPRRTFESSELNLPRVSWVFLNGSGAVDRLAQCKQKEGGTIGVYERTLRAGWFTRVDKFNSYKEAISIHSHF